MSTTLAVWVIGDVFRGEAPDQFSPPGGEREDVPCRGLPRVRLLGGGGATLRGIQWRVDAHTGSRRSLEDARTVGLGGSQTEKMARPRGNGVRPVLPSGGQAMAAAACAHGCSAHRRGEEEDCLSLRASHVHRVPVQPSCFRLPVHYGVHLAQLPGQLVLLREFVFL